MYQPKTRVNRSLRRRDPAGVAQPRLERDDEILPAFHQCAGIVELHVEPVSDNAGVGRPCRGLVGHRALEQAPHIRAVVDPWLSLGHAQRGAGFARGASVEGGAERREARERLSQSHEVPRRGSPDRKLYGQAFDIADVRQRGAHLGAHGRVRDEEFHGIVASADLGDTRKWSEQAPPEQSRPGCRLGEIDDAEEGAANATVDSPHELKIRLRRLVEDEGSPESVKDETSHGNRAARFAGSRCDHNRAAAARATSDAHDAMASPTPS